MKYSDTQKFLAALLSLIMVMLCMPLYAAADTEQLTVSYENRENVEKAIRDCIDENKEVIPSVSVVVFDDKQDICTVIYGDMNKAKNLSADENTVYEWGSVSKLLVWTSAMQLYEQGKLDLNADVRQYLPDGFLSNLSYSDPITMTDLMNHAAGFQETIAQIESENVSDLLPLDEALKTTAPAQTFRPGETVSYSNWGAALGGYIVSCISGMDYAAYVKVNIFDKLGMQHTYMRPDASDNSWAAEQRMKLNCYVRSMDGSGLEDIGESRRYINLYPAGSAGGTISDMAKFAKAFLCDSKDCPLFEKDDTLDTMLSPSRTFSDGTPRICHGLFYGLTGGGLYGHGGNTEGCSADLQLNLASKTGYVMMINVQSEHVFSQKLPTVLFSEGHIEPQSGFIPADISGHYKFGRSSGGAGMLKIVSTLEDYLTISKTDNGFTGTNGIAKVTQISECFIEAELINGVKHYYGIKYAPDGSVSMIESFQAIDMTKQIELKYYIDWAVLILYVMSVVIMSILFIVHAVRLRKFKDTPEASFKKTELFAGLCSFVMLAVLILIVIFAYEIFYASRAVYAAISIILCLSAFVEFILIIRCLTIKDKPRSKVFIVIETLCSILTIVGLMYYDIYQFWGF